MSANASIEIPDLTSWLRPVLGADELAAWMPEVTGPRRWWDGRLDVEGLALSSVCTAVSAARSLAGSELGLSVDAALVYSAFGSLAHLRIDGRAPEGFAPLSGYFPASDGWLRLHANYAHHEEALSSALDAKNKDDITAALRALTSIEAEQLIRDAGGVAAAVRTPTQWRASDLGVAIDDQPWIRFELSTDGCEVRDADLTGLRVLDLTRVVAGPTATQFLAALGADVLRIDPPHLPELLDQHLDRDFAKRSAALDLRQAEALEALHDLLDDADLLFTGYRPGALARFGLDWEQLHARHPHVVMVQLDAWGDSGPWSAERGFDSIVQAAIGIADLYAREDDNRPGALPVQALDHATGYGMAAAALALVRHRNEHRRSGYAHLSLARTGHLLMDLTPSVATPVEPRPVLSETTTPYGHLEHVPPPFRRDGQTATYRHGPVAFGTSDLAWR